MRLGAGVVTVFGALLFIYSLLVPRSAEVVEPAVKAVGPRRNKPRNAIPGRDLSRSGLNIQETNMSLAIGAAAEDTQSALPFYQPQGHECELFEAAFSAASAVLLKGPTGCGKTRFVAHMAARLNLNLDTIACHDDLTAADLTGRFLIKNNETVWTDGPLTRAVRRGGLCYLDEVVEARKDVTVVLHPLTDDRRILPLDRTGELLHAPDDFMLVISYNPGYQSVLKTLKPSTRQRFVAIAFDYPKAEVEAAIVAREFRPRSRILQDPGASRRTLACAERTGPGGRSLYASVGRLRQPDGGRHETRPCHRGVADRAAQRRPRREGRIDRSRQSHARLSRACRS